MANEVQKQTQPQMRVGRRGIEVKNSSDLWRIAEAMVKAGIAPKAMTVEGAFGVMLFGMELGLTAIQSLRDVCFINGRPSAYGDAVSALIHQSGLLADIRETFEGQGDNLKAVCTVLRKGLPSAITREFSIADAKAANLMGKDNWKLYTRRMLRWRAFSMAVRDGFADVLKGLWVREEVEDLNGFSNHEPQVQVLQSTAQPRSLPKEIEVHEVIREEIPQQQEEASPFDGAPQEEPAQVRQIPSALELYETWRKVAAKLSAEEILTIKTKYGVKNISPATPSELLQEMIQMAEDAVGG